MTLDHTKKLSKHICRLLKVTEITYPIGRTAKGNLGLCFNMNNEDFDIMLDSIPLNTKSIIDDDNNIELKKMIEKYWFESDVKIMMSESAMDTQFSRIIDPPYEPEKTPKGHAKKTNTKTA